MTSYVKWDDVEDIAGELSGPRYDGDNDSFENGVLRLFDALEARRVELTGPIHEHERVCETCGGQGVYSDGSGNVQDLQESTGKPDESEG